MITHNWSYLGSRHRRLRHRSRDRYLSARGSQLLAGCRHRNVPGSCRLRTLLANGGTRSGNSYRQLFVQTPLRPRSVAAFLLSGASERRHGPSADSNCYVLLSVGVYKGVSTCPD
jgi:hypothetical protein